LPYVIALVAALSVDDPLLRQSLHEERDEEGEGNHSLLFSLAWPFVRGRSTLSLCVSIAEEKSRRELEMEEQEREQRTKRRAAIISVHNIWAHPASDLLVILR
jgi:hypothetical protein